MTTNESDANGKEIRLGDVGGDRVCVGCGFNLFGQPLVREPVYGLVIARCPECGMAASLQDYPVLGKWAGRLAALLAAVWVLVLIALFAGSVGMQIGVSEALIDSSYQKLAEEISRRYVEHVKATDPQAAAAVANSGWWGQIDAKWWEAQDKGDVLEHVGGIAGAVRTDGLFGVAMLVILVVIPVGVFWSVATLHLARTRAVLLVLLTTAIAVAFSVAIGASEKVRFGPTTYTYMAAREIVGPTIRVFAAIASGTAIAAGAFFGRSIARTLLRMFLSPKKRMLFAGLWRCDGLEVPGYLKRAGRTLPAAGAPAPERPRSTS